MVSQLMMVPILIKKGGCSLEHLSVLGSCVETDEGIEIEFIARVGYFGDDETFMYDFWASISGHELDLGQEDLIRFEWDRKSKVKRKLP